MNLETKQCQNCQQNFTIEPEDFEFYNKIKVPAPTWCPKCQFMRKLVFRNEHMLYRRKDSIEGKDVISTYSQDKPIKVYEQKYWWSDKWDSMQYGNDYNFNKPFFEQFKELILNFPWPNVLNINAVNSEYCNFTTDNKNCYLVFGGDFNEDCAYSTFPMHSRDCFDNYWINKCELCYGSINIENCNRVVFSQYARDSMDSAFLYNCVNCNHCVGCVNSRNKSYCILNQQYTKEEYEQKLKKLNLENFANLFLFKNKFQEFKNKNIHRYAEIVKSVNSNGNNIISSKNCHKCFDVSQVEDSKNLYIAGWGLKDSYSCSHVGHKAELVYDSLGVFSVSSRVFLSLFIPNSFNIQYSYFCQNSSNLFACVGLRNKQYCILNKQYTKEEYEQLVPKIIEHMNTMLYIDKKGRIYKYGEFFPPELSPFAYNETIAQEYFPLTKEQAIEKGYNWKDSEERNIKIDLKSEDLPDHIKDINDDILNKVIECSHNNQNCNEQCTTAFKIIKPELEFYRKMNLPLPRLCPNCRHYQRLKQRNPLKLWKRQCMCNGANSQPTTNNLQQPNYQYQNTITHQHGTEPCPNTFETTYSSERPEIVYCEKCYNGEVV